MQRTIMNFGAMLFVSATILTSCGGGSNEKEPEKKIGDFPLTVDKGMTGDFSKYYEVTKAVLKLEKFGGKLMVEVKRTDVPFEGFDVDHLKFEHEGSGAIYQYDIKADLLGDNDLPLESSLGAYGNDPFVTMRSLKAGETLWLEFSAGGGMDGPDPTKAKKVKLSSILAVNENYGKESASSGSSDDSESESESDAESGSEDAEEELDAAAKAMLKVGAKAAKGIYKYGGLEKELEKELDKW